MHLDPDDIARLDAKIAEARAGANVSFSLPHHDARDEALAHMRKRGCVDTDIAWRFTIGTGSITLDARTK